MAGTQTYVGQKTVAFATTNGVAKALPGVLARVIVTATLTGSITCYDNASTNSGTVLWVSAANPTIGQIFDIMAPAVNGIFVTTGSAGSFNVVVG